MPYKIFKNDGKFAVHKIDEAGQPMGKPMGMHKTMAEAQAQMRALYASEKKPKEVSYAVTNSNGETTTGTIPAIVDDLEIKEAEDMMPEMQPMGGACSWEEMDAHEAAQEMSEKMMDMNYKFRMMADNVIRNPMMEDKAQALADLAKGYAERITMQEEEKSLLKQLAGDNQPREDCDDDRDDELKAVWTTKFINSLPNSSFLYVEPDCETKNCRHFPYKDSSNKVDLPHLRNAIARIPQSNASGLTPEKKTQLQNRARKLLEDATGKKELYIWKEGEVYKWLAAYSNNRRDNDIPPEIISSESHKEFDHALHAKEWPMPELWLWHVDYPVGITDYHAYDESTGFPVAAGHFYKGKEWAAEGILEAEWDGVSHGMPSEWIQRDEKDDTILVRHRTKEITFLPQWAAANKLAFNIISKESNMNEEQKGLPAHKREEFIKAFGEERVQEIELALENKAKEADEAGIEKKESKEEATVTRKEVMDVLAEIKGMFAQVDARFKALEEKPATEEKEEEPFDLVAFLQGKSAIGKPETKVDGRSTLAKDKPEEAEQPSITQAVGGIRISLADQFIGANQAWYQEKGGK